MKKIVVLSLLAVMLTGCVKQADYDDLVKQNAKLESKVESLEEENDELRSELTKLKETPSPTPTIVETAPDTTTNTSSDNDTLFFNYYKDDKTEETILASVTLNNKNEKVLNLIYMPSEFDSDYPSLYENKCAGFIGIAHELKCDNNINITILDTFSYCGISLYYSGDTMYLSSNDRDGTHHSSFVDGTIGDWLQEILDNPSTIVETSPVLWMTDTYHQIQKDIKGIYP